MWTWLLSTFKAEIHNATPHHLPHKSFNQCKIFHTWQYFTNPLRGKGLLTQGPFTLAKTKIQKTWVFCCTVYTARKNITFGVFGTKSACAKKPESHTDVLVSGAHARLLSTFDRTSVVRITSRAAVGWFRWRSCITWPKTRIIPARLERAFTLAKKQWNFGGVFKNHAAEVGFSIRVFGVFRGSCLATFNEKPECEKDSGFFMPV